jgi:TATA-binding protein-associated factor Taf7
MDISALIKIADALLNGGASALMLLLLVVVCALMVDRRRVLKKLDITEMTMLTEIGKRDDKIDNITESYFKGILGMTDALNGLRIVLAEINGRLLK